MQEGFGLRVYQVEEPFIIQMSFEVTQRGKITHMAHLIKQKRTGALTDSLSMLL